MSKLIFDIETSNFNWEDLDETIKIYFIKKFENEENAKNNLALFPSVSQVTTISLYNPETDKGGVLLNADIEPAEAEIIKKNVDFDVQILPSEKMLLMKFWEIVIKYNEFITFAGNIFDVPFLMFRSAVHRIRPSLNLYKKEYHIDLLEKLEKFHQRPSLHILCKAFFLNSPKEFMNGQSAPIAYQEKRFQDLIKYSYGDVLAIAEIYKIWKEYLQFE